MAHASRNGCCLQRVAAMLFAAVLAAVLSAVLSACGGGTAAVAEPPPTVNTSPSANAGPAQSVAAGTLVTLDGSASFDADGDALSYSWAFVSIPSGSAAGLSAATTAKPTFTPDLAGAYTIRLTVSDGRGGGSEGTVTVTATSAVPPAIALDQTDPVSGTVKLYLTGTVTGAVTWYVDLRLLGNGNASDANSIAWNTLSAANGAHQILARIQPPGGSATELRKTVTVGNSNVTLSAAVSGTTGTINVDVRATSSFGITSVQAQFDGTDVGTLSAPNACSRYCGSANDVYRFTVDGARVGSGPHTMVITARDGAGSSKTLSVSVPVSNAPVIALTSPSEGELVSGTLRVAGSVSSDKPGAVTTKARLGDVEILNTQSSSFSGAFDLSGVAPGSYTVTVQSTDSAGQVSQIQRGVVVTSGLSLVYTPAFILPAGGSLLAAESTRVLYTLGDGGVAVRDLLSSNQVQLAGVTTLQYATDWQLSEARVYAQAKGSDCTPTFNCIYEWSTAGARRNLSVLSPYTAGSSYQENPVARGGYVIWTNWNGPNPGSYTLYNAANQTFRQVAQPAAANYIGNTDYDFAVSGSVVDFWFWGQTAGEGTSSQFDIFRWRSDTGASSRITSGGSRNIYPQVDGSRAAWQRSPVGGNSNNTFALTSSALSSVAPTTLSETATTMSLRDGVLAWVETPTTTSRALKASAGGATRTLSSLSSASLLANGSGWVIYAEAGKTYSWNSATNVSKLRLDVVPSQAYVAGGALVFTVGTAVYRVGLD